MSYQIDWSQEPQVSYGRYPDIDIAKSRIRGGCRPDNCSERETTKFYHAGTSSWLPLLQLRAMDVPIGRGNTHALDHALLQSSRWSVWIRWMEWF